MKIYQNSTLQKRLKMVLTFSKGQYYNVETILSIISKGKNLRYYNDNVNRIRVENKISSDNSALVYMVLKPFSRHHRERDFLFLRHIFR